LLFHRRQIPRTMFLDGSLIYHKSEPTNCSAVTDVLENRLRSRKPFLRLQQF